AGIYGVEEDEQGAHLILEYVEGQTLAEYVRHRRLAPDESFAIMKQVASGIAAAHQAGGIHRDLKPGNSMVTGDQQVKILDFGLAKELRAGGDGSDQADTTMETATMEGTVLGTPPYMSPEQAHGRPADARTDVWSFGVILYELLVGGSLFERESVSGTLAAVLTATVDFDAVPRSIPAGVRHVLRRCIERDVERRWCSMADIRIELECVDREADSGTATRREIVEGEFQLRNDVCRRMNRDGLDPLVVGWPMRYSDNQSDAPVLLIWVPSFGSDHTTLTYRNLVERCPCRMVIPTPIGMEAGATVRPQLSLENQLVALHALAEDLRSSIRPSRMVVGGASCGGTMALRLAAETAPQGLFDGVLLVDPDITSRDCFVTGLFAGLQPNSEASVVDAVCELGQACDSLDDWLALHEYMVQSIAKMRSDLAPLIRQASELTQPFSDVHDGGESPTSGWLRQALDNVGLVRCFFPSSPEKQGVLGQLRMAHLEDGVLGDRFKDDTFVITSSSGHLELLRPENTVECINEFLERLTA
ncbi:MAG: serine/threonine-protein kinase, partial [Planctomycetota bacterium]